MKKNNLLIFKSLLSILPLITLAIFPTLINSIEEINQSLNNKAQITSNQNQEINFETTIKLNTSTSTDASSGKQNLFNHTLDKSGFINTNNSFEFDLNKFKPWGMETDLFLESTKISLSGPVVNGSFKGGGASPVTYKKRKITPSTAKGIPENSTLKIDKILGDYISTNTKIFTFDEKNDTVDAQGTKAYITINKTLDVATNILKITPEIIMEGTNTIQSTVEQKLMINFSSPYFDFEPRDKILGNQYVSSQDRLSLSQVGTAGATNEYFAINSKNEGGGRNSIPYKQSGDKLFKIDVGNFYWNNKTDTDGKLISDTKPINVNIQGLEFSNLDLISNIGTTSLFEGDIATGKTLPINFNFEITPNDMSDAGIIYTFDIFNNTQWSNLPKDADLEKQGKTNPNRAEVSFVIKNQVIKSSDLIPVETPIPYNYYIEQITFSSSTTIPSDAVSYKVNSSNLKILTSPDDYSFLHMEETIKAIANEVPTDPAPNTLFEIESDYSSDIFNDDHIIEGDVQKITNYEKIVQVMNDKLLKMLQEENFLKAGIIVAGIDSAANNKKFFGEPFSSSNYTSKKSEYLSKGIMKFNVSPLKDFKYFNSMKFEKEFIIKNPNNNNIIDVSLNQDFLAKEALKFQTFDEFIIHLNESKKDDKLINTAINRTSLSTEIPKSVKLIFDLNKLCFSKTYNSDGIEQKNIVTASLKFKESNFKVLQKNSLLSQFNVLSEPMSFDTAPSHIVNISFNQKKLSEEANKYDNYASFAKSYNTMNKLKVFINEQENIPLIENISLVDPSPLLNLINIKVELLSGIFDNDSKVKEFRNPNINWKGQNNIATKINIEIIGSAWDEYFKSFDSSLDFIEKNKNKPTSEFVNFFRLNDGSVMDNISSISFSSGDNPNSIKIHIQAKEWFYFENEFENIKMDLIVFKRGNISWKGQEAISKLISIDINWKAIYEKIKNYKSMKSFIANQNINFWTKNVIVLNPASFSSVKGFSIHTNDVDSLIIKINLNNGFYFDKSDTGNLNYVLEISKENFEDMHKTMTNPDSIYFVDIVPNYPLISYETKKYPNAESFFNVYNTTNRFYEFISIKKGEVTSIKEIKLIPDPNNPNTLIMTITLNSNYFFLDTPGISFKEFSLNNIVWEGETPKLTYIDLMIDSNKFLLEAHKVKDFAEFQSLFSTTESLGKFISFTNGALDNLKSLSIKEGASKTEVIFVVELKSGFYFKNESYVQAIKEFKIGNIAWEGDDILLNALSISIDGNKIMEQAKLFNNFDAFSQKFNTFENLKKYLVFKTGDISKVSNIFIFKSNMANNQIIIRVTLKPTNYFENEDLGVVSKDFLLGNIYYALDKEKELIEAQIEFNKTKFYDLIQDYTGPDLKGFIEKNINKFFNPLSDSLAVLIINPKDINIIASFSLYTNSNNDLILRIILKNGYYWDTNNKTNVELNWKITKNNIVDLHNEMENKKINDSNSELTLIISLSTVIPIVVIAAITTIIIVKRKKRLRIQEE